jgi:hypothetical protein
LQRIVAAGCQENKKMKRKLLVTLVAFALSPIACKKDSPKSNTDNVLIRIENATAENFSNFTLNGFHFGGIASGDTSAYQRFKNVPPLPFANDIAINDRYLYILDMGHVQFLLNGKYRMKVVTDTTPSRYQASFVRE